MSDNNPEAAPTSRPGLKRRLNLVPLDQRWGIGGTIIGVANAGPAVRVGISLPDLRYHAHILGPTGTGKTTLLMNMILDDIQAGRGVAAFDPAKGDLIRDLLDRMPTTAGDRLVLIDPDEQQAPPSINLLDPQVHGGSPHDVAANLTAVMSKVWARWWGHRSTDLCYHGLLTLAHVPGSTLAQLPRLLSDTQWRASRVAVAVRAVDVWEGDTLTGFWQGFNELSAGQRSGLVAPLLSRLRLVLAHPLAMSLFGVAETTFSFKEILDGGILLCRLPKGIIGEDGTRLIGSLLLAGLWQATTARARIPEAHRPDATVVLDECHNFLHLPIGIDDALAEARGLHTSFVLAHQYLGQLSSEMAEAIDANARNKIYFALAPRDATDQARHLEPYLDDGDLIRLGGYEVVLRPVANGRIIAPVTADTEPAPPPIKGRAAELRHAARGNTGLSQKDRQESRAVSATTDPDSVIQPHSRSDPMPMPMVGRNTFSAVTANHSLVNSNDQSNDQSNGDENTSESTPVNSAYAHVNGVQEQW